MKRVAIISQPLRASHCRAYLDGRGDEQVILTSDPSAFDDLRFETPPRVVPVSPPPELLPSSRLTGARLFRTVLSRARSGSSVGRRLERAVKRIAWRLRYLDRLVLMIRRRKARELTETAISESVLYAKLVEEHGMGGIGELVVFDVFDLPVALAFARDNELKVLVR